MSMKCAIIKTFIIFATFCLYASSAGAKTQHRDSLSEYNDSLERVQIEYKKRYLQRYERFARLWNNLIPAYTKIQYAGNMGMFSFGIGWQYGSHEQWETDLFFGFIPKHSSKKTKLTFTLKQNFTPWKVWKYKHFYFEPLSCGIYINSVFSDEFWSNAPDKYPNGYYWFSTKVRTNIFVGQRLTLTIPQEKREFAKSVTLFYEISTHDFAIIQATKNSELTPKDYLSISFGIKFNWGL